MATVHLGCGPNVKMGDIGVDIIPGPAVDVVHDLNEYPWPLDSDTYDRVLCKDILEHLTNIPKVMEEIYRISKLGAEVVIQVPTGNSPDLFTDPTHVRGFGFRSFNYFDPTSSLFRYGYSRATFSVRRVQFISQPGRCLRVFDVIMMKVANKWPRMYEERLGHLYPMKALQFVLAKI